MKRNYLLVVALSFCIVLALATFGHCGTYYVSPSGSAGWGTCINTATPCAPSTAMANAVAGDTVYFLSGTYNIGQQSSGDSYAVLLSPTNSGTSGNPITFKSLTPLGATLYGTVNGDYFANLIGSENGAYITWDGFRLTSNGTPVGMIYNAAGVTIKNCEIVGTTFTKGALWPCGIEIRNGSNGAVITNNYIHDIVETGGNYAVAAININGASNTTVSKNTIKNCSAPILDQGGTNNVYSYNFLLPIAAPGAGNNSIYVYPSATTSILFYQNIILGASEAFSLYSPNGNATTISIYNNTIYTSATYALGLAGTGAATMNILNNIIYTSATSYWISWDLDNKSPTILNNNDWYAISGSPQWQRATSSGDAYSTAVFANWKSTTSYDLNSVVTDPGFVAPGLLTAGSYKRTSYPANGYGGSYPTVMGAYVTGAEQIGYSPVGGGVSKILPILQHKRLANNRG